MGTPGYMAPEIVANRPKEGQTYDGKTADLWSCGVILYIMLCARFPFERPDDAQLTYQDKLKKVLQRIVNVHYSFPRGPRPLLPSMRHPVLLPDKFRVALAGIGRESGPESVLPAISLRETQRIVLNVRNFFFLSTAGTTGESSQ